MDLAPPTPESVVATLGIGKFLDATARTWNYVLDDAARLPKQVADQLRRYLTSADREKSADLPDFDLDDVNRLLLGTGSAAQADAIHRGIPDQTLANGVIGVASRIIEYLKPLNPSRVRTTMTGPISARPGASAVAAFRRVYQVADDPMIVLRDLAEGSLSRGQVRSLQQLYPQIYTLIGDTVPELLANIKAGRGKGWQLPRRKEQGLARLLGADETSPLQLAEYQRTFAQQDAQGEAPHSDRAPDTEQLLTPGQRHA